ncbi:MAG: type I methionyl aminopeptidase [Acidimicrobiia bacterium]|nr:type I methionyl aminopeptidase [Acidimicrobiia bacterium]
MDQIRPPNQPTVHPGTVSARRAVPNAIPRPDYARSGRPRLRLRPEADRKSRDVLERMRRSCRLAADVLATAGRAVAPGVTTDELDELVHLLCIEAGAYPSPLNYHDFPKSVCTSVNEVICHGIPDDRPLVEGDIVNLDVTVYREGVHGDTNATFLVGEVSDTARRLVSVTERCLDLGIAAVAPGRPISDIGLAIERHALAEGYGVVEAFVGHGIGETFHTELHVPHYFNPSATTRMVPGMVFTIEPMLTTGRPDEVRWSDGWTAVTRDLGLSAQFEHTVAVTADGVEVLTAPPR